MAQTSARKFTGRKRLRKFFGHIREAAVMPNLIEVQKASYDQFLLVDEPKGGRPDEGLQSVFKSVFPISTFRRFPCLNSCAMSSRLPSSTSTNAVNAA